MDEHSRPDALLERVDLLACAYPHADARELLGRVDGVRQVLGVLRQTSGRLEIRRDLLVASGWATLLAACLRQDIGHRRVATRLAADARRMGKEAGEQRLIAWGHEIRAWQEVSGGSTAQAQAIAHDAREIAPHSDVAVQLAVQEAKAAAINGDRLGAIAALNAAERLVDHLDVPSRPEHHFVFDRSKAVFYGLQIFDVLGEDRRMAEYAQETYYRAVAPDGSTRWPMRIAQTQLALAHARARGGDLDGAVTYAGQALDHARQSGPSLLPRLIDLDQVLYDRWPGERRQRELRKRLREHEHQFAVI